MHACGDKGTRDATFPSLASELQNNNREHNRNCNGSTSHPLVCSASSDSPPSSPLFEDQQSEPVTDEPAVTMPPSMNIPLGRKDLNHPKQILPYRTLKPPTEVPPPQPPVSSQSVTLLPPQMPQRPTRSGPGRPFVSPPKSPPPSCLIRPPVSPLLSPPTPHLTDADLKKWSLGRWEEQDERGSSPDSCRHRRPPSAHSGSPATTRSLHFPKQQEELKSEHEKRQTKIQTERQMLEDTRAFSEESDSCGFLEVPYAPLLTESDPGSECDDEGRGRERKRSSCQQSVSALIDSAVCRYVDTLSDSSPSVSPVLLSRIPETVLRRRLVVHPGEQEQIQAKQGGSEKETKRSDSPVCVSGKTSQMDTKMNTSSSSSAVYRPNPPTSPKVSFYREGSREERRKDTRRAEHTPSPSQPSSSSTCPPFSFQKWTQKAAEDFTQVLHSFDIPFRSSTPFFNNRQEQPTRASQKNNKAGALQAASPICHPPKALTPLRGPMQTASHPSSPSVPPSLPSVSVIEDTAQEKPFPLPQRADTRQPACGHRGVCKETATQVPRDRNEASTAVHSNSSSSRNRNNNTVPAFSQRNEKGETALPLVISLPIAPRALLPSPPLCNAVPPFDPPSDSGPAGARLVSESSCQQEKWGARLSALFPEPRRTNKRTEEEHNNHPHQRHLRDDAEEKEEEEEEGKTTASPKAASPVEKGFSREEIERWGAVRCVFCRVAVKPSEVDSHIDSCAGPQNDSGEEAKEEPEGNEMDMEEEGGSVYVDSSLSLSEYEHSREKVRGRAGAEALLAQDRGVGVAAALYQDKWVQETAGQTRKQRLLSAKQRSLGSVGPCPAGHSFSPSFSSAAANHWWLRGVFGFLVSSPWLHEWQAFVFVGGMGMGMGGKGEGDTRRNWGIGDKEGKMRRPPTFEVPQHVNPKKEQTGCKSESSAPEKCEDSTPSSFSVGGKEKDEAELSAACRLGGVGPRMLFRTEDRPPGPMRNSDLLDRHGRLRSNLREGLEGDFVVLPWSLWDFFSRRYGGGPCLIRFNADGRTPKVEDPECEFVGTWKECHPYTGEGRLWDPKSSLGFEGEIKNGYLWSCRGNGLLPSGDAFEGEVRNGLPQGTGRLTRPDGSALIGHFFDGKLDGWGVAVSACGEVREGALGVVDSMDGGGVRVDAIVCCLVNGIRGSSMAFDKPTVYVCLCFLPTVPSI
uniref:DUSP domain-containing protein n=1 Tax=Chromera velia CCMP2878 TaxID=1169474 RepID=A0A0G4HAQ7_9ALVE|eukprot:Cvel_25621.t1-p1 / transcript=Cvel_25621.t1 / gene=Cvel_25621 / organism=Chromera_velia_CCMP2878 / gene_product=hypothetical protein / transcript_product=hypothetical protein / location=Cvel_scaffold2927:8205-16076(+) / protein_length=1190 / sequence_SO=supercontig / SO=protein_coding / is_pseudo=false